MFRPLLNSLLFLVFSASVQAAEAPVNYLKDVQPILDQRCVACHGCYEGPCQFNAQTYEGVRRGFSPIPLYSGKRVPKTSPTRMVDGKTLADWRNKEFYPVVAADDEELPENQKTFFASGLMYRLLEQGSSNEAGKFSLADAAKLQGLYEKDERQCLANASQMDRHFSKANPYKVMSFDKYLADYKQGGMPFGLPRIASAQSEVLNRWLGQGAPGPSAEEQKVLSASKQPEAVAKWEAFFNGDSAQQRQTARYIYEHIFSATLHLDGEYFELVRSRTKAPEAIDEIVTKTPIQAPGVDRVYYRMRKITHALVHKTANIWHLSDTKLEHLKTQFGGEWSKNPIQPPTYTSNNMFKYFEQIPAAVRSTFLQENSRIIVGAMVQGTVCIGSRATYAIADHFWAWFLKPDMDPSVQNPTLGLDSISKLGTAPQPWEPDTLAGKAVLKLAQSLDLSNRKNVQRVARDFRLALKFLRFNKSEDGDSALVDLIVQLKGYGMQAAEILGALHHFIESTDANQEYQAAFELELRKLLAANGKQGLSLNDLWKGDGDPNFPKGNPNAWLSITRHEKSATVQFGPEGGYPQSIWVMSYSNFERLYYNLVAHFEVWESIAHKLATWRHMQYVRLEGEDLAISLMPIHQRATVRHWFTNGIGGIANGLFFPLQSTERMGSLLHPIPARPSGEPSLAGRDAVTTRNNFLHELERRYKSIGEAGQYGAELVTADQIAFEKSLKALQNRNQIKKESEVFAQYLPNISYVAVQGPNQQAWAYTLLANRGYKSHTIVILENPEKDPRHDTLSVYRGMVGGYPHLFLSVSEKNLGQFATDIAAIRGPQSWTAFRQKYAVARNQEAIWTFFDWFQAWKKNPHPGVNPSEQGISDLSQYLF